MLIAINQMTVPHSIINVIENKRNPTYSFCVATGRNFNQENRFRHVRATLSQTECTVCQHSNGCFFAHATHRVQRMVVLCSLCIHLTITAGQKRILNSVWPSELIKDCCQKSTKNVLRFPLTI